MCIDLTSMGCSDWAKKEVKQPDGSKPEDTSTKGERMPLQQEGSTGRVDLCVKGEGYVQQQEDPISPYKSCSKGVHNLQQQNNSKDHLDSCNDIELNSLQNVSPVDLLASSSTRTKKTEVNANQTSFNNINEIERTSQQDQDSFGLQKSCSRGDKSSPVKHNAINTQQNNTSDRKSELLQDYTGPENTCKEKDQKRHTHQEIVDSQSSHSHIPATTQSKISSFFLRSPECKSTSPKSVSKDQATGIRVVSQNSPPILPFITTARKYSLSRLPCPRCKIIGLAVFSCRSCDFVSCQTCWHQLLKSTKKCPECGAHTKKRHLEQCYFRQELYEAEMRNNPAPAQTDN